jgi:hypothetical protein
MLQKMNRSGDSSKSVKITAMPVGEAARILAAAFGRRITPEQVGAVVDAGCLARADGTFNLIEYVAFLVSEVANGRAD